MKVGWPGLGWGLSYQAKWYGKGGTLVRPHWCGVRQRCLSVPWQYLPNMKMILSLEAKEVEFKVLASLALITESTNCNPR